MKRDGEMEDGVSKTLKNFKCAVIVAHPDDETLWAGGTILMNPDNKWTIVTATRRSDADRRYKYNIAMNMLNADGQMGDVDDGPEQSPIDIECLEDTILSLLDGTSYDLIVTHSPQGEYTRHRRHEEVAKAVIELLKSGRLHTKKIWMFAYTDHHRDHLPRPIRHADICIPLPPETWEKKYNLITETYGFSSESWEAKTTPRKEAFWSFSSFNQIEDWIENWSN